MTVEVYPDDPNNTHHVRLSDGSNEVGLILCDPSGAANPRAISIDPVIRQSIKFYTGEQRFSDLEPPWQDIAMTDFSGGRGSEIFEDDTTRYWDSYGVDTTKDGVIMGPLPIFDQGTAIKANVMRWPGQYSANPSGYSRVRLYGDSIIHATKFTVSSTFTGRYLYLFYKIVGGGSFKVQVAVDNAGSPDNANLIDVTPAGGVVGTAAGIRLAIIDLTSVTLDSTVDAGSGEHWLILNGTGNTSSSHIVFLVGFDANTALYKVATTRTGTWSADPAKTIGPAYFRIEADGKNFRSHFAELRKGVFCAAEYEDGTVSKVFTDGAMGTATSGAAGYIRDTNNAAIINNDSFNGGMLEIVQGTGSHLPTPIRYIDDTLDTNSEISVAPDWALVPDNTSQYVVHGADRWYEVTGHGLAAGNYFSDALSVMGAIYFAAGPAVVTRRLRFSSASPYLVWSNETVQATLLEKFIDGDTTLIFTTNRTVPAQYQYATAVDNTTAAGAALTMSTAANIGDTGEKVTGLTVYGEVYPQVYVFKEGSIHRRVINTFQELRIGGMKEASDARNGYASCVSGVYLYLSYLNGIERYYSGNLDDMGPDKDGAMPYERKGMVSDLTSYLNKVYASIDAGRDGVGSIMAWNGRGWHDVFRFDHVPTSWVLANTIPRLYGKMFCHSMPGDSVDRMYFSYNGNIISLNMHPDPFNSWTSDNNQNYLFMPGGWIETGWINMGLENISKLFNSVTVNVEEYYNSGTYLSGNDAIFLDYKLDTGGWIDAGEFTITNGVGKIVLDPVTFNVTSTKIKLRIRIENGNIEGTPKIKSIVLEGLVTVPSKRRVGMTCRLEDYADTLRPGVLDDIPDADTKISRLRGWAALPGTLAMSAHISDLDGLRVKLDYPSIKPIKHTVDETTKRNTYIMQIEAWVIE